MGECLRKSCPCLQTLRDRIFGKSNDGGDEGITGESDPTDDSNKTDGEVDMPVPQYPSHSRQAALQPPKPALQPPKPALQPPQPRESGVYTALWSFEARAEDELSFDAGDLFNVINRSGDWWTARRIDPNGHILATGIVPFNYLARGETGAEQPWFFGKMNRFEALSHLLSPENGEGAFLVRLSETDSVGHVLSVKVAHQAKHFKVHKVNGLFYVDPSHSYSSLLDLIEHYRTQHLSSGDRLGKACVRKEPQPHDLSHSTVDEWELPKEEFILEEQLGSGYFAEVYKGKWKNRISVAIKILKNDETLNQREFQLETQILKKLRHRHLISLFAICTTSTPYYIITELMEKGNLLDFLRGQEGGELDRMSLIDMAAQVADGMAYLEAQNSIHRDLAARNVLVGENYICKVADFGLARIIKEPFYICEDKKIPYKWTAPEAISHGRFSNKSDVWSFGILLYEMFTYGGVPYPGLSNGEVHRQITEEGYRMPPPPKCPEYIYGIMLSCWSEKPEDRPNFKYLKPDLENVNRYEMGQ